MEKPHEGVKSPEEAVWMDRGMEEVEVKKRLEMEENGEAS